MLKAYGIIALLFFLVLLVQWWPQRHNISVLVVVFGTVFWPISLFLAFQHYKEKRGQHKTDLYV